MTPIQFHYAIKDWERQRELDRELAYISADVNVLSNVKTSQDLLKFPWEKDQKLYFPKPEEWQKWDRN